jgi:hypothetical protein
MSVYKKAVQLVRNNKVKLKDKVTHSRYLQVKQYEVRINTFRPPHYSCTCRNVVYNGLCSHVIASIIYLAKTEGGLKCQPNQNNA